MDEKELQWRMNRGYGAQQIEFFIVGTSVAEILEKQQEEEATQILVLNIKDCFPIYVAAK